MTTAPEFFIAAVAIGAAGILAFNEKEGWGWFIFIAVVALA